MVSEFVNLSNIPSTVRHFLPLFILLKNKKYDKFTYVNSAGNKIMQPLILGEVTAGFPSPSDDHIDQHLSLDKYLVQHPAATFFVRARGQSMIQAGISTGDLLIVDRSLTPRNKAIIIAFLNGEFTVKRFLQEGKRIILQPENPQYKSYTIQTTDEFDVWGVVTTIIKSVY